MTSISLIAYRWLLLLLLFSFLSFYTLGQDCSQLASNYRSSVVSLSIEKTKKETGAVTKASGTGFIVSPDGYVLTAYHVVAEDPDTDEVQVYGSIGSLFAQRSPLDIIATDKSKDIALLEFKDSSQTYKPIPLGNPFKVSVGGQLCSLSFSAPLNEDFHITIGALSTRTGQDKSAGVKNLWTTQMPSNFGESGAPVLDLNAGGVVALKYGGVVSIMNPNLNAPPQPVQNVNYLIPINMAITILGEYCNVKIPQTLDNAANVLNGPNEPTLESVQVTFITKDEGKDSDTRLAISITKGNTLIASDDDIAHDQHLEHEISYGPFSLKVQTPVTKTIYKNSSVAMMILPNGHDRWATSLIIEARFSDNQVIKSQFGPIILDQDTRVANFQNP